MNRLNAKDQLVAWTNAFILKFRNKASLAKLVETLEDSGFTAEEQRTILKAFVEGIKR